MKLLRRVGGLERGRPKKKQPRAIGLAWTESAEVVDREPGPGEHVALDVHVLQAEPVKRWRTVERIATDPEDWGFVYDALGGRIGRVVGVDGGLVDMVLDGDGQKAAGG